MLLIGGIRIMLCFQAKTGMLAIALSILTSMLSYTIAAIKLHSRFCCPHLHGPSTFLFMGHHSLTQFTSLTIQDIIMVIAISITQLLVLHIDIPANLLWRAEIKGGTLY